MGLKCGLQGTVILVSSGRRPCVDKPNQLGCMRADQMYGIALACSAVHSKAFGTKS